MMKRGFDVQNDAAVDPSQEPGFKGRANISPIPFSGRSRAKERTKTELKRLRLAVNNLHWNAGWSPTAPVIARHGNMAAINVFNVNEIPVAPDTSAYEGVA